MRSRQTAWKLLALGALTAGALSIDAQAGAWQANANEPDFIFGACTHRWKEADVLPTIRQAGIMSNRDEIPWGSCEKEKGAVEVPQWYSDYIDKSIANGLSPLNILLYANKLYDNGGYPKSPEAVEAFAKYCEKVVTVFKGRLKYYQVWNEWDGGCGMSNFKGQGDAESYVKLLSVVYPRIKAIDPSIIVMANSVCTGDKFLQKTLDLGVIKHCDALTLHTYNYGDPKTIEKWYERMQGVDKFLRAANGDKEVPLYITEMGWPTQVDPRGSTEEASADNMARLYLLARTMPYIKGLWWYDYRDDGWDYKYNENNFGMVRNDLTPKRSWFVMKDLTAALKGATFVDRIDVKDPAIFILKYKREDGQWLIAARSQWKDVDWQLNLASSADANSKFKLTLLGCGSQERTFSGSEKDPVPRFSVVLRARPFVLEGDLEGIKSATMTKRDFPESERPTKVQIKTPGAIGKAIPASSNAIAPIYNFAEAKNYRSVNGETWSGKKDLDAFFTMRWTKKTLLLKVEVVDDVFCQEYDGADTWMGDGLQLAFHKLGAKDESGLMHSDIDVALTKQGPKVYRQIAPGEVLPKELPEVKASIKRDGAKITYDLEIPVKAVYLPELSPGTAIGFSLLVNDNDGKMRKGYMRWGDGIGHSKDPSEYNWMVMEE